jgi:transcriptional regulator CtsR
MIDPPSTEEGPVNYVIATRDFEANEWYVSRRGRGGYVIPRPLWEEYVRVRSALDAISELMDESPYITTRHRRVFGDNPVALGLDDA